MDYWGETMAYYEKMKKMHTRAVQVCVLGGCLTILAALVFTALVR